jgi:DNA-binding transcriptional LysR family regulator
MSRPRYSELTAFMAVAEQRNFTKAAAQLGLSTATLSQTIRAFEEQLGVRLLNRTPRSVSPTEAGDRLLSQLRPLLDEYDAVLDSINEFRDRPAGAVRLTVAPPAAHSVIAPRLAEFTALYPDIRLEISVDPANIDIVANQFDAGIRLEGRIDNDMIAVRVSEGMGNKVVGAPQYLAQHPAPKVPQDLAAHNCLRVRLSNGATLPWRFGKGGKELEIAVSGSLIVNSLELMIAAVLGGVGLLSLPSDYVAPYIADGRLVPVLEDWMLPGKGFFLYYPSRRHMPASLQAVVDFFRYDKNRRADGEDKKK